MRGIIKRAGVKPWGKLWQNLRSSCATELADQFPEHVLTKWLGNTPKVAKEHYLQVTDEHWRRAVTGETKHGKIVAESTAVPSGLGMNRAAQSFRKESVTVDSAMRNTHLHKQVGVTRWARQDSNLCEENPAGSSDNQENGDTQTEGASKSTSLSNDAEQIAQIVQAFQALTPEARNTLLQALVKAGGV